MNRKNNHRKYRPAFETLESRALLAGGISATFANHTLTINGTSAADVIQVNEINQRISIDGTMIRIGTKSVASLATTQVGKLVINGKAGDDFICLSHDAGNTVSRPSTIFGGDGNDQIWGGKAGDKVYGGNGNDILCGMDGTDYLYGQAGNDQLYGGVNGNDRLDGGTGQNFIDRTATHNAPLADRSSDAVNAQASTHAVMASYADSLYPTALDAPIGPNDTRIKVRGADTGTGNVPFLIQVDGEIMRVTQVVDNATWTVQRGVNATTPQSHDVGAYIDMNISVDNGGQKDPTPPAILSPIGTAGSITPTFTWTPAANAVRYEIFVADPTASKVLNPTNISGNSTTWVASSALVSGTTYTWWVRAFLTDGSYGPWSLPKTFQVTGSAGNTAPFAPTNLSYVQLNTTDLTLSWSNVANEAGYILQYWDGTGWTEFARTGADVTSTTVTGGIGLYLRVGAYNGAGSNFSQYLVAADGGGGTTGGNSGGATGYTSAPTGLTWSPTTGNDGRLAWSNVDGETGYVVEYWTGSGWAQFASTPADVTQLDVTGGAGSYLRVGATTNGATVYSNYVLAAAGTSNNGGAGNTAAPDAPTGLRWAAGAGNDGTLFWSNVNGETGYVIDYWNGSAWSQFATTGANVNSLYVTNGAGRYLRVGAYNGVGTTYSEYVQADEGTGGTTGGTNSSSTSAPTAPTQLTWSTSVGNDGNLYWSNATGETSYVIEYWTGATWVQFASVNADVTTLYVTNGVGNYFRVGARNSFGTTYSDYALAG